MSSAQVIILEKYLEIARRGYFSSIAISATGIEGHQFHYAGEPSAEPGQLKSVLELALRLQTSIDNWQPYATDWSLDASYAGYHCGDVPDGFDFLTWLLVNEMARIEAGAPGPLKVAFWQGRQPKENRWVDAVYRPMLGFIGAVEDNRALQRMGKEIYVTKALVDMVNLGMELPKIKAKGTYDLPRDCVTITLRECDHWPHRNSDIVEWVKFARWLGGRERVVFVRDTAMADWPLIGFETCPLASRDLDARMWLYENSKLNMFVSNGPAMLGIFSQAPFLDFTPPEDEGSSYIQNMPLFWKIKHGIEVGSQYPWSSPRQRIVWEKATFDSIKEAWINHGSNT